MRISDIYKVYINDTLLPQTPETITKTPENKNEVITLADGSPFTLAKKEGPATYEFDVEITQKAYPYTFKAALQNISAYKELLEGIKKKQEACTLTVIRTHGQPPTCVQVLLDDYTMVEDAKNASDVTISLKFTEYHPQVNQELDKASDHHLIVAGEARGWVDEVDKTALEEEAKQAEEDAAAEADKEAAADERLEEAAERAGE